MDRESLFVERERLIELGDQAKAGDADAVDELLTYALRLLVEEYNRNLNKGRKPDVKKADAAVYWATRVAILQLEKTGKINEHKLTSETLLLAEIHGEELARSTTKHTIVKHIRRITRAAAFAARPVKDSFKENVKAIIEDSDYALKNHILKNINGRI